MTDSVNHPKHYNSHPSGVECVDVNEHLAANVAAAIKYLWRKDVKHPIPVEDLRKAEWYLTREIERLAHPQTVEEQCERVRKVIRYGGDTVLERALVAVVGGAPAFIERALGAVREEIAKVQP